MGHGHILMSELSRKPSVGEYILGHFNRLMDTVRRERVMAGDGILVKQTDGGKVVSAIRQHPPNQAPWFSRQTAANTIRVNKGRWTRNSDLGKWALELDCSTNEYLNANVSNEAYLSAVLTRNNQEIDPRLEPDAVRLVVHTDQGKSAVEALIPGGTYYGGHLVLGKMTSGKWTPWYYGGDITDDEDVGDADSVVAAANGGGSKCKSIERTAGEYGRFCNEDQVRNFRAGTAAPNPLGEGDRLFIRVIDGTTVDTRYATPADVVESGGGYTTSNPPPLPDHGHTDGGGDGGDLDEYKKHHNLTDNTSNDDHGPDGSGDGSVVLLSLGGDAERNAMSGLIGDSNGDGSIYPNGHQLLVGGTFCTLDYSDRGAVTDTSSTVGADYTDTPAALGDAATLSDLNDLRAKYDTLCGVVKALLAELGSGSGKRMLLDVT